MKRVEDGEPPYQLPQERRCSSSLGPLRPSDVMIDGVQEPALRRPADLDEGGRPEAGRADAVVAGKPFPGDIHGEP